MNQNIARLHRAATLLLSLLPLLAAAALRPMPVNRTDLSNLHVNALTQDSLGYIWVGTANGLCRDNGKSYDIFFSDKRNPSTLPSNNVTALFYDRGTLWVATVRGIASKAAPSNAFVRYEVKAEKPAQGYYRGFIKFNNRLFTYGYNGLYRIDPADRSLIPTLNFHHRDIEAAAIDHRNRLWVASWNELICLDSQLHVIKKVAIPTGDPVSAMLTDGSHIILGTSSGLIRLNPDNGLIEPLPGSELIGRIPINTLIPLGNSHRILIGTRGDGPLIYNRQSGLVEATALNSDLSSVRSVDVTTGMLDNRKNLWLGTFDKGVFRLSPTRTPFNADKKLTDCYMNNFVTRIIGDRQGRLIIGTRYKGLSIFNPDTQTQTHFNAATYPWLSNFPGQFVQEEFLDSSNRLWVGMDNGLFVAPLTAAGTLGVPRTYPRLGNVVTIAEDALHRIWVGTSDGGLHIFNPDLSPLDPMGAPIFKSANITRVMPYDAHRMLVASYLDNVYLVDINSLASTALNSNHQNQWDMAIDVFRSRNGNLWIGTYDNGLLCYTPRTGQLKHYTDFKSHDILAIREDAEGNIWCSSSYGIYRIDPRTESIQSFLKQDGMPGNQYHEKCSFDDGKGNIFFGGNFGLQQISPKRLPDVAKKVPVYLTQLRTINRNPEEADSLSTTDVPFIRDLNLDHDNNAVAIGFTALNYSSPTTEYAYMLEGFDNVWIYPGEYNNAIYSNLPPGSYRFLVKVKENDAWSEPTMLLNISVDAAPWLHPLAKIGYAILVILLALMLMRLYIRLRLEKERLTLAEQQVEDERIMSQRKVNFFNNISHELRTPITLIYAPVKFLRKNYSQLPPKEIETSLEYIEKNVDRLLSLTTQILKFRTVQSESLPLQVSENDLIAQIDNIIRLYNIYAAEKDLTVTFIPSRQSIKAVYDNDKLEKILNNLLFNAVKYTPPKGHITVRLDVTTNPQGVKTPDGSLYMELSVCDDGVGIPAEENHTLFTRFKRFFNPFTNHKEGGFGIGLNFVKHLVVKHHGVITYHPNPVKGTTFIVDIPISREAYSPQEWEQEGGAADVATPEVVPTILSEDTMAKTAAQPGGKVGKAAPSDESDGSDQSDATESKGGQAAESKKDTEVGATAASDPSDSSDWSDPSDEPTEPTEPTRHKLLIVEDKEEMAHFIAALFREDADVVIAADGVHGLQLVAEEFPDIIITDVMMPLMDGCEMLERIKTDPATCHIPVVMLSAKTRDEDAIRGYTTGADIYMAKPFNPEVLHAAVLSQLARLSRQKEQLVVTAGTAPDDNTPIAEELSPLDRKFLKRLYGYINDNIANTDLSVTVLSRELGLSRTALYRKIKALIGVSPNDLLRLCRLNRAAQLIRTREFTIGEISDQTGFGTQSHFSNSFRKHFGMSPREYITALTHSGKLPPLPDGTPELPHYNDTDTDL